VQLDFLHLRGSVLLAFYDRVLFLTKERKEAVNSFSFLTATAMSHPGGQVREPRTTTLLDRQLIVLYIT